MCILGPNYFIGMSDEDCLKANVAKQGHSCLNNEVEGGRERGRQNEGGREGGREGEDVW